MTQRIPRNLVVVGIVSLLMDLSSEMVFPLLPAFLASLGASGVAVGIMEGAADSVASLIKYASGRTSDRLQRRKAFAVAGYGLTAIVKAGFIFATAPWHVIALRAGDRVGKGIRGAPRDALIAESMPRERWGFAFGLHRAFDTTGALLAPFLGAILVSVAGMGIRGLFAVALIPAALSVVALAFVTEERSSHRTKPIAHAALLRGPLFSYLFTVAVFSLSSFGLLFLLLRAAQVGLSPTYILITFGVYNLVYAGLALPMGSITDRIGRVPLVAVGISFQVAACLASVALDAMGWIAFLVPAILFGAASAGWEGNGRALAADLAPPKARGTVLGAYHAAIGFSALPGGLLAGLLWDRAWPLTFIVGAILASAALLELLWLWSRGRFRLGSVAGSARGS